MAGEDREGGEQVLRTATAVAREVLGDHLSAAFALGSLAHGGFAPLASDVDLALVLDALPDDIGDRVADIRRATVERAGNPPAERLSVFWSDWHGVRHGAGPGLAAGIDDAAAAVRDLRAHLVGVYVESFDAYAPAVAAAGRGPVADALLDRRATLLSAAP